MTDIVERLRGYNPPDRTLDGQRYMAVDIQEAADEIERLRAALEKIAGRREYERADYDTYAKYKTDEGLWTFDEYVADAALPPPVKERT